MVFIAILIITTLSIAGSAAFFSIYGLAQIFTGSFWPVVLMATSLEAGKLVSASYLYRYWDKLSMWIKWYLIGAIFVLMLITSAGIFGLLSAAYQHDVLPLQQKEQQIQLLENEKREIKELKTERLERRKQIDADIASLPNNYVSGRQRLLKSYGPELKQIRADIVEYTDRSREITNEIHQLKAATLEQRAHTGPIVFIAKVFNSDMDQATKWVIMLIIFAFDPLAVILTVGANIAIIERKGGREYLFKKKEKTDENYNISPEAFAPEPVIVNQGITAEELERLLEIKFAEHEKPEAPQEPLVINQGMSVDELETILNEKFSKEKLSAEQQIQKTMVQEMLAKKKVKERLRNGTQSKK